MARVNTAAEKRVALATDEIFSSLLGVLSSGEPGAVIASAPAGGGKTHFVTHTVKRLFLRGHRVMVCSPTNKQVGELVSRLLALGLDISFLHAKGRDIEPGEFGPYDGHFVSTTDAHEALEHCEDGFVLVSTVSKAGFYDEKFADRFDVLVLDEAYQVPSSTYLYLGNVARAHLLVGDPGQLSPFSTAGDLEWWKGLAENPIASAVDVILSYHPTTAHVKFPLSRRLDYRAVSLAARFYEGHDFEAYALEGTRFLSASLPREAVIDLDSVNKHGFEYHVLGQDDTEIVDPVAIAERIADIVEDLVTSPITATSEAGVKTLGAKDILVGVSTNEQADEVMFHLAERKITDVAVLTANKAQGLQFDVAVVWHPLAGLSSLSAFHVDTGRLCVLTTRHTQALFVVGTKRDAHLLRGVPLDSPVYPGRRDPVLAGWYAHQAVIDTLNNNHVSIAPRRIP